MSSSECLIHDIEQSCLPYSSDQACTFTCEEKRRSPLSLSQGGGYRIPETEPFCIEHDIRCLSSPPEPPFDIDDQELHREVSLDLIQDCSSTQKGVWGCDSEQAITADNDLDQATTVSSCDDLDWSTKLQPPSRKGQAAPATRTQTDPDKGVTPVRKRVQELYGQPSWWGEDNEFDDERSSPSTSYNRTKIAGVQPDSPALMEKIPSGYYDDDPKSEQWTAKPAAEAFIIDFSVDTAGQHRTSSTAGSLSQYVPTRLRHGFLEREKQKKERERQAEIRRQNAASMVEAQHNSRVKAQKVHLRRAESSFESKTPQRPAQLSVRDPPRHNSISILSPRRLANQQTVDAASPRHPSARPTSLSNLGVGLQQHQGRPRGGSRKLSAAGPSGRLAVVNSTPASPLLRTQNTSEKALSRVQNLTRKTPATTKMSGIKSANSQVAPDSTKSIGKASGGHTASRTSLLARETKLTLARRNAASLRQTGGLKVTDSGTQRSTGKRSSLEVTLTSLHGQTSTFEDRSVLKKSTGKDVLQQHRLSVPRGFMSPTTSSGAKNVHLQDVAPVKIRPQSSNFPVDSFRRNAPKGQIKQPTDSVVPLLLRSGVAHLNQRSGRGKPQDVLTTMDGYLPKRNSVHGDLLYTNKMTASLIAEIETFEDPKDYLFHRMFQGSSGSLSNNKGSTFMNSHSDEASFLTDSSPEGETKLLNVSNYSSKMEEYKGEDINSPDSNEFPVESASSAAVIFKQQEGTQSPASKTYLNPDSTQSNLPTSDLTDAYRPLGPVVSSKSPVFQRRLTRNSPVQSPTSTKQIGSPSLDKAAGDLLGTSMLVCTSVASLAATYILDAEETLLVQQDRLRKMLESGQSVVAKPISGRTSRNQKLSGQDQAVSRPEACDLDAATPRGSPDKEFEEFERLVEEKGADFWEPAQLFKTTTSEAPGPKIPVMKLQDPRISCVQAESESKLDRDVLLKTETTQPTISGRSYMNKDRARLSSNLITVPDDTRSQDDINLGKAAAKSQQSDALLPGLSMISLAKTYVIEREKAAPSDSTGLRQIVPEGHELDEEDILSASIEWVTNQPMSQQVTTEFTGLTEGLTPTGSPLDKSLGESCHVPPLPADTCPWKSFLNDEVQMSTDESNQEESRRNSPMDESAFSAWPRTHKESSCSTLLPSCAERTSHQETRCPLNPQPYSVQGKEVHARQLTPEDHHLDALNITRNMSFDRGSYPPDFHNLHQHYLALQTSVRQQLLKAHEQEVTPVHQQLHTTDNGLGLLRHPWASAAGRPDIVQGDPLATGAQCPAANSPVSRPTSATSRCTLVRMTAPRPVSAWNRHDCRNRSTTSLDTALKLLEHSSGRMETRSLLHRSAEQDNTGCLRYSYQKHLSGSGDVGVNHRTNMGCSGTNDCANSRDCFVRLTTRQNTHHPARCFSLRLGSTSTSGVTLRQDNRSVSPPFVLPENDRVNQFEALSLAPGSLRSSGDGVSDKVTNSSSIDGVALANNPCEPNQWNPNSTMWIQESPSGGHQGIIPDYRQFDSRTYTRRSVKQVNTQTLPDKQMIDSNASINTVQFLRLGGDVRPGSLVTSPPSSAVRGQALDSLRKTQSLCQPAPIDLIASTSGPKMAESHRSAFRTPIPQNSYLTGAGLAQTEFGQSSVTTDIQAFSDGCKTTVSHVEESEATISYTCIVDSIHQLSVKLKHCSDHLVKRVRSDHPESTNRGSTVNADCWQSASSPLRKVPSETKMALSNALTNMQAIKDQLAAVEQLLSKSEPTSFRSTDNDDDEEAEDVQQQQQQLFTFVPIDLDTCDKGRPQTKRQASSLKHATMDAHPAARAFFRHTAAKEGRRRPPSASTTSDTGEAAVARFQLPSSNCLTTQQTIETHHQWNEENFEDEFY